MYRLPTSFNPDSLRVIGYNIDGYLPEHTDMYMVLTTVFDNTVAVTVHEQCDCLLVVGTYVECIIRRLV